MHSKGNYYTFEEVVQSSRRAAVNATVNRTVIKAYACPLGACAGNNTCNGGRVGLLCGFCPEYTALELNVCAECERDSAATMILQIVVGVLALLLLFLILFLLGWRHVYPDNLAHRTYDKVLGIILTLIERVSSMFETKGPVVQWKEVGAEEPVTGTEIKNDALATAISEKQHFTKKEVDDFNLVDFSYDSYIKVGGTYFQPDEKVQKAQSDPARTRRFIQAAKIFFAYYQVISTFIVFKVRLPEILETSIKYLHSIGKILSLDIFEYPGLGCLVGMPWFQRLIVRTLTPLFILVLMAVPVAISYWRLRSLEGGVSDRCRAREMQRKRHKARLTQEQTSNTFWMVSMSWLFLVFPSMTLASLEAFSCEQIGSQKYLSADLEELCPTPDDASYWFSVLMTAFWVVGTPVFTLWSMIYHKVPHMANQKLKESVVNQMISEYSAHAVDPSRRKLANSLGKRVRTMETVSEEDPEFQRRIEDLHETIFPDCNGYGLPKLCAAVLKRALSFREASGLRWDDVGTQPPQGGTELDHASLSEALSQRKTFTEQEWTLFRIQNLQMNHFIKSGDSYYRPASGVSASRNRLTFADLQKALRKWFEDMDINVNSYLDATELQLEFEHLGMGDAETASIFISSFDVDKNGHLDLEEFQKGMMHILDNSIPGVGSADLVLLFSSFSEIESDRPVSLERFASFGRRLCEKAFVFSGAERAASATAQQLLVLLNYPWKRRRMEAGEAEVDDKIETEMEMPNTVPLQKSDANKPSTKFEATSYGVEKYEGFLEQCKILSRNIGVTSTDDDMDKATVFDLPVLFDQILQALDKLLPASPIEAAADRETDNIFKLRGKVMKSKENFKEMLRGDVEKLGLKLMDEGVIRPPPLEWDGSLGTDEVKAIERLGFLLDAYQVSVWYWEVSAFEG